MTTNHQIHPYIISHLHRVYGIVEVTNHETVDTDTCDQLTVLSPTHEWSWSFNAGHTDTKPGHHEVYTVNLGSYAHGSKAEKCIIVQTPDRDSHWSSHVSLYEPKKDHSYCLSLDELNAWIDSPSW